MDEKTVEKLAKFLRGGEGDYKEKILSEIYSEVNQIKQKQDEMMGLIKEWLEKER